MQFLFPDLVAIDERSNGNKVQQLIEPAHVQEVEVAEYIERRAKGYVLRSPNDSVFVLFNAAQPPEEFDKIIRMDAAQFEQQALLQDWTSCESHGLRASSTL